MKRPHQDYRNHRCAWTLEEIRYLERHYGHMTAKDIAEKLGRTAVAVRLAAKSIGVAKIGQASPWTDEEKEILRTHYAQGEGITRVCERLPGRKRQAIFAMVIKLGISSPRNWSDEEIVVLEQGYANLGVKVAQKLPGRTEYAVKLKACSLKLKYRGGDENGAHQRIWSEEEWQLLKWHRGLRLSELMKFFPNRSLHSVKKARERLRKLLSVD